MLMKINRLNLFWGGIIVCTLITGIYIYALYCNYSEQVAEWNVLARETFVEALKLEVQKRGDIVVPCIVVDSPEGKTLETPYQSPVTLTSRYGTHDYDIPRVKFDNSLIQDTEKRMILSYVLGKHPLNVDVLNISWDSLLARKSVAVNTGIRLSITDLLKKTSVVYFPNDMNVLHSDSLLSRYIGFRCEVEVTGFVSHCWWQVFDFWQTIVMLLLPWICFCVSFLFCRQIILFLRNMFGTEKMIIQEKTVVIEKEIHLLEVNIKQAEIYELDDGVIFDTVEKTLKKGEEVRKLAPQVSLLLKLFLQTKDYRLTASEIYNGMWNGKGSPNQLYVLIRRLKESLKGISSLIVDNENGDYCLKKPHFIEKDVAVEYDEGGQVE